MLNKILDQRVGMYNDVYEPSRDLFRRYREIEKKKYMLKKWYTSNYCFGCRPG